MKLWGLVALVGFLAPVWAQGPRNVLLVVNTTSAVSRQVGEYYRQKRGIPAEQVCNVAAPDQEHIERAAYERNLRGPVGECLVRGRLQDRVLYLVLAKGVPLIIDGSSGPEGDLASVDSELTLLYQDLLVGQHPLPGKIPNPYYVQSGGAAQFLRFSHRDFPIYLVTRLDGYDLQEVKALIDRGLAARRDGRFILDLKLEDETHGNTWLRQAADRLKGAGIPPAHIVLETTAKFLTGEDNVLGYASWGSNDPADPSRHLKHKWVPGAVMTEFVSTNARTFQRPPAAWNIGKWKDSRNTFFKGSPQSLIADYLAEGATGAAGNVDEPYLDGCVRPQILLPAYAKGLNLAESFYAGMPYLSWKGVVVGDPLVAPFPGAALPAVEANPPVDSGTRLPLYFARRRVAVGARATGEKEGATHLLMAAEQRLAEGDRTGARRFAEQALQKYPDSAKAMSMVALLTPQPERAIALYRRVVELTPGDAQALNNLAYTLATRGGKPEEALPFAARALDIAQSRSGSILDTYGWVLYLLGKPGEARTHLEKAQSLLPANAEVAYHLGMSLVKLGRPAEGRAHLERALTLKPDAETAAAVHKALQ